MDGAEHKKTWNLRDGAEQKKTWYLVNGAEQKKTWYLVNCAEHTGRLGTYWLVPSTRGDLEPNGWC
jgi:hypothetical protein